MNPTRPGSCAAPAFAVVVVKTRRSEIEKSASRSAARTWRTSFLRNPSAVCLIAARERVDAGDSARMEARRSPGRRRFRRS